jgi:fructokinase
MKTIVAIGEILWDMFPDGPQFGGAPANFASSVAELGGSDVQVHIISAVGRDELGRRAVEILRSHGVGTDFVCEVDQPTGQVLVHLDPAGQASYEFAANTAWDNVPWSDGLLQLAARADVVCFGTLGQRSSVSRETIREFVRRARPECLRILDINLRPPFWDEQIVSASLELANIVKINDTELAILAEILGWKQPDAELIDHLLNKYALRLVALTRGADGAAIRSSSGEQSDLPGQSVTVVNTVGAGDAYTAALAIGALGGLPLEKINAWANRIAAFVCTQPGAAPHLPDNLRQH